MPVKHDLPFGECARLVSAENIHAAEILDCRQLLHAVCNLDQTAFTSLHYRFFVRGNLCVGPNCLRSTSNTPTPPQLMMDFTIGLSTVFTKSASRNFDSKECSKQEAGTIPAKWLVAGIQPNIRPKPDGKAAISSLGLALRQSGPMSTREAANLQAPHQNGLGK